MKNYKRLTERITASNTGRTVLVIPAFRHKIIQQTNRLAELEDKIESGELCDSKETEAIVNLFKEMRKLGSQNIPF